MAREGARVAALDICKDIESVHALSVASALEDVVKAVEAAGSSALGLAEDVRSSAQVRAAVSSASPGRIGLIARAAFVLVLFEHKMIT